MIQEIVWNGLKALKLSNEKSECVLCLNGAHVVSFRKTGGEELFWVSQKSTFQEGKSIRGGIPVCWPWFGPAHQPAHGLARIHAWTLFHSEETSRGTVAELSYTPTEPEYASLTLVLRITAGETLRLELITHNLGQENAVITEALHTYFAVTDIEKIRVAGLDQASYLDKTDSMRIKKQTGDVVFSEETDRIYGSESTTEILDETRTIRIRKEGSGATVLWNPFRKRAEELHFADGEYRTMVCVETANAGDAIVTIPAGGTHTLLAEISEIR